MGRQIKLLTLLKLDMYSKTKSISNKYSIVLFLFSTIIIFSSCKKENTIKEFNLDFSNLIIDNKENKLNKDTLSMIMDMTNAITEGINFPTINQSNDGLLHFKASVENKEKLFYKIYYQNESYKYDLGNEFDNENFYGSWEETDKEFKEVPVNGIIEDALRIVGNPRNEKIYYGANPEYKDIEEEIYKGMERIRGDANWLKSIEEKAKANKISVDDQLYRDMCWVMQVDEQNKEFNNRFKRNPRTGIYSFLLVVVNQEALNKIPKEVKNIAINDSINGFTNPYTYFINGKGKSLKGVSTMFAKQTVKLKAVLNAEKGVYVDILSYPNNNFKIYPNNGKVGSSEENYTSSLFQQFFHNVPKTYALKNVPLVKDILDDSYTSDDYFKNKKKYSDTINRIIDHPYISDYPAKTVRADDNGRYISLINPGNKDRMSNPRKESVGVKTRVGFTYGKFRGKIKFPAQLNKSGVWSGITNAFWLIYQSEQEWNKRRICNKDGYVKYSLDDGTKAERTPSSNYSEIDIEIIKTSKYWPEGYQKTPKGYDTFNKDECILACTNWDLACPSPSNFFKGGTHKYKYINKDYTYVRWFDAYRALTSREAIPNNIFHKDYYYYEIEWKPNEIIWRIGESPEKMYIVGYMSDKFTVIPNNQMLTVITQEYHYSEFWPPVVYDQNFLPFPMNDIEGRVYEVVVE
ncbi:MAG: hypothetical protein VB011_06440 [Bacteroidales bacterium]|nr:hypothetical protein [Bacteroidales bacterium]